MRQQGGWKGMVSSEKKHFRKAARGTLKQEKKKKKKRPAGQTGKKENYLA